MPFELSEAHAAAVRRRRRVAVNFDVLLIDPDAEGSIADIIANRFQFADDPGTVIDSIWWNWCD